MEGPAYPGTAFDYVGATENPAISETATVLVLGDGEARGEVKCGDVIGVAITAPLDAPAIFGLPVDPYGLYIEPGNVVLAGAGRSAEDPFTGDVIVGTRFVLPTTDELDCASGTLVITIESAGTESVYDPATGELVQAAAPGAGVVSIE